MKRLILFLLLPVFVSAQSGWNMNLLGSFDYDTNHNTKCNDIWGWEDDNGNEFALVGLESGFSCVDVTDPSTPIEMFYISDINSIWRDIKTWGNYAYITTEADAGLLVVDLTDMTGNTYWHLKDFTNNTTGITLHWEGAHNIYIDENGIAYIFGASNPNGWPAPPNSAIFLDVANNPTNPEYLGEWDDSLLTSQENYIHDGMVRGDTMYAGCIYGGKMHIVDVSDKSNPQTLGQHSTPNNFTHNAWVSDDGNYVFTTDEQSDAYLAAYNISDINNIYEVDRIQSNPGSNSIPHNAHVDGNFLITSYYRDGTTVHDITYPNHMVQVAYYDSYSGSGNGFDGCWGTYPFLTSGNIISSDRNSYNGKGVLNIYGRAFQQACYLMGNVTDGISGNNLASADITILSTTTTAITNIIGDYQTAVVDSGLYEVVFSKTGYISDTLSILLDNGIMTTLNAQLFLIGSGCTDPLACNYDASATINDSSCVYPIIWQQSFSICNGDSIIVGNSTYNSIGNYIDTLAALNGCDSIVYTNISITPPSVWQWGTAICDGDSVVVGTSVYNTIGNYTDTLTALNGCDSIVYTNISMLPPVIWQQAFSICDGDSILVGSNVYNTAGNYTDTLNTVNGCDSIVYTNISMDYNTSSYDTLSVTSSIVWNGSTLSVSGDYSATLINLVGCDSIAYLNLTITHTTGVIELINNKQLVKITDMLAQETPYRRNTPLFYIYNDGTVEKRIVIE
jgi:choice-of-anchor B domain-containing protein